jgi:hypothetical protein
MRDGRRHLQRANKQIHHQQRLKEKQNNPKDVTDKGKSTPFIAFVYNELYFVACLQANQ